MKARALLSSLSIAFIGVALCFTACRRQGINQELDPNEQKPYDFMSTKNGSYWKYGTREGLTYRRYARQKDTLKNGLTYSYYERQDDSQAHFIPEYYGKNGTKYVTLLDLDGGEVNYLEYVFWLEDAKKGSTWQNTGVYSSSAGTLNVYTNSSETEDDVTLQYGGLTFTKVVHVHSDLRTVTLNSKIGTIDMWFLKDVGVIREEAHINVFGAYKYDHTDSLIDYHIEP
jgi:hypothetical protein